MATKNDKRKLPSAESVLSAREYVDFLRLLENGLPDGTRCYLVTKDVGEARRVLPVKDGASVLNLQSDLLKHLNDRPLDPDWLLALRAYCEDRLKIRRSSELDSSLPVVRKLLIEAIQAILSIRDLANKAITTEEVGYMLESIRFVASQAGYMTETALDKINGEKSQIIGGAEAWLLPDSCVENSANAVEV